jgi:RNA polymerase sigma-70 factor (ECF subfamily)
MPEGRGTTRIDESELLEGARRLDETALRTIFDVYYEPLYRYIYRHIGVSLTAEDLVADVFRSLLEQLQAQRGPTTYLKAWLYRVAHNLIVDELRRNKHRDHDELDEEWSAHGAQVQDEVQQSFARQVTNDALQGLTDKQRAVLELKYLHGLDAPEIAQTLKMSVGTVKALQHRGLQAMRRQLKQKGVLDETDL